jgi:phospholipase A1/A2
MRRRAPNHSAPMLFSVFLATLAWGASGQVLARSAAEGIQACAAITADLERLACYDRASGRPAAQPGPVQRTDASAAAAPMTAPTVAPHAKTAAETAAPATASLIDGAWGLDSDSDRYLLALYRPNYLQIARFSNQVNNHPFTPLFQAKDVPDQSLDPTEARFQLSFKARLWTTDDRRWGLWAAYTQQSQWQIYNEDLSRPFRETNYMPEIMLSHATDVSFGGFKWRLFNIGYNHQSNGRADPISRSWDRIIAEFGIERGDFALLIRPWYRIQEDEAEDDNPDITDYYGYGDLTALYKWRGNSFSLMGRGNLDTWKGAAQFTWTSPPILGPLRGYVQAFTGYGDSLIDYNWRQNSIGIGIALNDLLDRE